MSENNPNPMNTEPTVEPTVEAPIAEASAAPTVEAPVSAEPAKGLGSLLSKLKGLIKTPAMIAAVSAVGVVAAAGIGITAATSTPAALLGKGLESTVESVQENPIVSVVTSALKGGSAEVQLDLDALTQNFIEGSAAVKVYTSDKQEAAVSANLVVDDKSLLDATVVADKDNIAASSEVLFGEKAYGINLEKLVKNFEDSAFGPDGKYSLGIELDEEHDAIAERTFKMSEAAMDLSKDMTKTLMKSLKKHAEMTKEGTSMTFAGESIKVNAVTLKMDDEVILAVVGDMLTYLKENEALRSFLKDYADLLITLSDGELGYDDKDELIDDFYDALDDVDLGDLEDALDEVEPSLSATFYISKSEKALVGLDCTTKADGERVRLTSSFGPSWDKLNEISVKLSAPDVDIRFSYLVTEDTKQAYTAEIEFDSEDGVPVEGTFEWDKKSGGFELGLESEYASFSAEGELALTDKELTLLLDSIHEDDYKQDIGITLILKADDKMPSMPKYTDVLEMTEEDVEDLVADLQDAVRDLAPLLWMF